MCIRYIYYIYVTYIYIYIYIHTYIHTHTPIHIYYYFFILGGRERLRSRRKSRPALDCPSVGFAVSPPSGEVHGY